MSKRIIENSKYRTITCSDTNCACKYTFDKEDIVDGNVSCPVCGKQNPAPTMPTNNQ